MTAVSHERSLGTLIAIARTRVAADSKSGEVTPPGIVALANIGDESAVRITCNGVPGETPLDAPDHGVVSSVTRTTPAA